MYYVILLMMAFASGNQKGLTVTSPDFAANEYIPAKFTCDGTNVNPTINVNNIPEGTVSLALVVDDPDATNGTFDHWVIWNISPEEQIVENSAPGMQGLNGKNERKYTGPCPPSGIHHYYFKVYALDKMLDLGKTSGKAALEAAMQGHILEKAELIGLYKR